MEIVIENVVRDSLWVKSITEGEITYRTKAAVAWRAMNARCNASGSFQMRNSNYVGCSVSEDFKDFQKFAKWYSLQVGSHCNNYHLDKDILVSGNKTYGESTCVLVPQGLNNFLLSRNSARGEYPQGVSYKKRNRLFQAQINISGRVTYLGLYQTPEEASAAYKVAKEGESCRWYERLCDGEFVVDPRVIERMRTWTLDS